jgi:hypothetical protein
MLSARVAEPTLDGAGRKGGIVMLRTTGLLAVAATALLLASPLRAGEADEASHDILLGALRSNKKAMVDANLGLTDDEARAFWPVYDRYQGELAAVQDRLAGVIEEYKANFGSMSHEKAHELVAEYLDAEKARADVRSRYLKPVSETLPGRKVMRFYQIENKIDAVLRYQLAAEIPVVEQ